MQKLAVIISPNWKDYAQNYLADCLASLRKQTYKDYDLFLIDNESSEQSFNFLKKTAPEDTVIPLEKNEGFAGGNNAAIKLAIEKGYDFIFLVNMDTVLDEKCLAELMAVAQKNPQAAIQSRLMLWPETNKINSLGNVTHFLGFGYCDAYGKKITEQIMHEKEIAYPSGAAVLLPTKILKQVGLFDEGMWMYNEDQDLGWRFWLSGHCCLLAPQSVVYHKYEFSRSIKKLYWLDRNRIIAILKNYHVLTLLLILPAFIVMELGLILFSLKSGWLKEKIRVWQYFLSLKNWHYLLRARRQSQMLRQTSDRKITKYFSGKIWYQEIDDVKLRFINPIFNVYWKIVRLIMFW